MSEQKQNQILESINSALAGFAEYFDVQYDSSLVDDEDHYVALFTLKPKAFDTDDGRVDGQAETLEFAIFDDQDVQLITGEDTENDVTATNLFAALYFNSLCSAQPSHPAALAEPITAQYIFDHIKHGDETHQHWLSCKLHEILPAQHPQPIPAPLQGDE